jgi:phosphoglycerate kinase
MSKKTIDDIDVRGRRVLMRVDFNVPMDAGGAITDDRRIRSALPSIRSVIDRGGRLILVSHSGRPKGKGYEAAFSLAPCAARLRELLGDGPVGFPSRDCIDAAAGAAVNVIADGEILLLENLRFHDAEKTGDAAFAARLAAYGDVYCNDAFGTAHRDDASMVAVPRAMAGRPRVAGLLLQRELAFLSDALEEPRRPFVAILGGAKVSDKLGCLGNLIGRVDRVLVGGAMAYTFIRSAGIDVGRSRVEQDRVAEAGAIREAAGKAGVDLVLPSDHVCATTLAAGVETRVFDGPIADPWMGLDIGPRSIVSFERALADAGTVVWNGPLGVFETPPFDRGTRAVATAVAQATGRGAVTVAGGGDTAAALEAFGLAERLSHVSTGGGASLELLEGRRFESVALLDDA